MPSRGSWYYEVLDCGFKYNMSDIQAAMGVVQLRKLESFIETRRRYAGMYNAAFADVDEMEVPPNSDSCRHSWHLYAIRLNLDRLNIDRAEFIRQLRREESVQVSTSSRFLCTRSLRPLPSSPRTNVRGPWSCTLG